ncbi:hypothetical protein [Streptomyces griseocarneus]|nr:hypothetical protein [Streptomyces griseocarneus]MBZ6472477.1 hypothetical protein [Streptomyces griseocarneus]GHG45389.1 hypothetical protein GCM10018779_01290 [Streptomyces griseocarneus]
MEGAIQIIPLAEGIPEVAEHVRQRLTDRTVTWWNPQRGMHCRTLTSP